MRNRVIKDIAYIINLMYASIVIVDKIHNILSLSTIIYLQILLSIVKKSTRYYLPRIIGITRTTLTNSISLTLNFAEEIIKLVANRKSNNKGIR